MVTALPRVCVQNKLKKLYKQFDADKNGNLNYQEFQLLVQACTDEVLSQKYGACPPAAGVASMLTTPRLPLCRTLLELFDEVRWRAAVASLALTMYVHMRHPQLSKLDGPESGDIVSANAFAYLCAQHGIVAPDDM